MSFIKNSIFGTFRDPRHVLGNILTYLGKIATDAKFPHDLVKSHT